VSDGSLIIAFATSLLIHLGILPLMALVNHPKPALPTLVSIGVVDAPKVEESIKPDVAPTRPQPKPRAEKITAPKLLSKPTIFDTPAMSSATNTGEEIKPPEKPPEAPPTLASLTDTPGATKAGWNVGSKSSEAEGNTAGAGNLFGRGVVGVVGVVGGRGVDGGGGGTGASGLGRGSKGDGTGGGGIAAGDALTGLAHPLGGYQVKPRYPESARRAGVQGTTLLKLRVLENGRVGDVMIEQSAGHRDLDSAAAEAVKKWLFEPARLGKEAVAVWVLLPVKFELQR
jgi:protein TonB